MLLTFPGNASTIFFAPLIATLLHPELLLGKLGVGYPPPPPLDSGIQHLKVSGPGHLFVSMVPLAQEEVKRQFPALLVPQAGLVQHLMSAGVPGQALEMNVPPAWVHLVVGTQTPGALDLPVQGPFSTERRMPEKLDAVVRGERRRMERRDAVYILERRRVFE
jgi:hypothetical protein